MRKCLCLLLMVVLTGCASELHVETRKQIVEYGEDLAKDALFDAGGSDANIEVIEVKSFDDKKVGEQQIVVVFSDGNKTVDKKMTIVVQDTKKPLIELKKKSLAITVGDKLSLKDNVKSVKDPVDGNLEFSKKKIEKNGYYIDDSKLNTKKAGTYEVKVIAKDVNGNEAKESFKVVVKKKQVVKPVSEPTNKEVGNSNTPNNSIQLNNTNTSNNTSKGNASNNTNKAPTKNDTSSSGNKTNKPSSSKKDDGKLCPLGKDPYKSCNAIVDQTQKYSYGVYPTIEKAMIDGNRLALDESSTYYMRGFTAGPLFNNLGRVAAYTIFWN